MRISPTESGRAITGDTPWGRFRIELRRGSGPNGPATIVDADGLPIGTVEMEFRDPNYGQPDPVKEQGCGCSLPIE